MIHHLKIWPGSFEAVLNGSKLHEIRNCEDRHFVAGDMVVLEEWNPEVHDNWLRTYLEKTTPENRRLQIEAEAEKRAYTGRRTMRTITYVSVAGSWGLPPNICVFSIFGIPAGEQ